MPLIFAGRDFTELAEQVRRTADISVEIVAETDLESWSSQAGSADREVVADRQHHRPAGLHVGHHCRPEGRADFAWRIREMVQRRGDGAVGRLEFR